MVEPKLKELPVVSFPSESAWEKWLLKYHESLAGVWIKFAKKQSGIPTVTYAQALDVALCHGWIDGQVKRLDDSYYLQRFTPRTLRSKWSKINCGKAARLLDAGRMRPAGLKQIEAARADGRWSAAYDSPKNAAVPPDLQAALRANERARKFFQTLDRHNRYAILHRIQDAKRPETRARRIDAFVEMLAKGKKLHGS
jgi:uncharacterized protein YdeI (YjbR/CyaY-like superfamily)